MEKAAHRDELELTRARAADALKEEEARAERTLEQERQRHREELAARDALVEQKELEAQHAGRRLLFSAVVVAAVVVFFVVALALGLDAAWAVLLALAVLIGLGVAISQWARWHS